MSENRIRKAKENQTCTWCRRFSGRCKNNAILFFDNNTSYCRIHCISAITLECQIANDSLLDLNSNFSASVNLQRACNIAKALEKYDK